MSLSCYDFFLTLFPYLTQQLHVEKICVWKCVQCCNDVVTLLVLPLLPYVADAVSTPFIFLIPKAHHHHTAAAHQLESKMIRTDGIYIFHFFISFFWCKRLFKSKKLSLESEEIKNGKYKKV